MTSPVDFQPNVQTLQSDVVGLLERINALMCRANETLESDGSLDNKYPIFIQEIEKERKKVENLELVMAIVAPMKAGKSTIVNAIVGQRLLPSRNAAMTTLPTEIILNGKNDAPVLRLTSDFLGSCSSTIAALQKSISRHGIAWAKEKIREYPHLIGLLEEIAVGNWNLLTKEEVKGQEEITKELMALNDIIRLCSLIDSSLDPLDSLTDVPKIETPLRTQFIPQSERTGNLVIVDTPGPNEADEHHKLATVVTEQLRQSSIVLIVLDFTGFKTIAAEKVKQEVEKVIQLRGKENLYVLVNKIDQRRDNDMTSDQVRQFVFNQFRIGGSDGVERVFEVSARDAFCATNFLRELSENPDSNGLSELSSAKSLAQQSFGRLWERTLPKATVEMMQEAAREVWDLSGFPVFLENAISALMANAAPRCMRSALNLSRNRLKQLQDDVKLRRSGMKASAAELQRQIEALEADLHHLNVCRNRLKRVDEIKKQLKQETSTILANIASNELPYEALRKFGGESSRSFDNYSAAESFQGEIENIIVRNVSTLLDEVRDETKQQVEASRKDLVRLLENETQPIIEAAQRRLNKGFNISLSFNPPNVGAGEIGLIRPRRGSVATKTRYWDEKENYTAWETRYERRLITLFLWPHQITVPVTKTRTKTKSKDYYVVSKSEITSRFKNSIRDNLKQVRQTMDKYIQDEFQRQINLFFENLDVYLSSYRDSLKKAQEDQKLATDKKEKLAATLESLVPQAEEQIRQADLYLQETDRLM